MTKKCLNLTVAGQICIGQEKKKRLLPSEEVACSQKYENIALATEYSYHPVLCGGVEKINRMNCEAFCVMLK